MDSFTAPEAGRSLLLTIDVQRDFTLPGAPAEIAGTAAAVPNMARLVDAFRRAGRPIVHMIRLYREDGSNVDLCRREAVRAGWSVVRPGSAGAGVVPEIAPVQLDFAGLLEGEAQEIGAGEWIVYKPRWGALYQTPLERMIAGLGVNTVVVCGCNFPNCPRTTVYEASERDLRVMVVEDALSGLYEQGRKELLGIGVQVASTDDCLAWASASTPARGTP